MTIKPMLLTIAVIAAMHSLPAAATITSFVGPWAPVAANGFAEATGGTGTFTTSVSADGLILTSHIANAGDPTLSSFFLENYGYAQLPAILLPLGPIGYDYAITYSSPSGQISTFDDFGNSTIVPSEATITGHFSENYAGGYFGYFGVNIAGFDGATRVSDATAVVTLTNLSAGGTIPEPASLLMLAGALTGLAIVRQLRVTRMPHSGLSA